MTAAELVRSRLLAVSGVTDLVGATGVDTLLLKPGATLPRIRVQTISGEEPMHLRGSSGLRRSRVQVDVVASVKAGGDALASARDVAEAIDGDGAGSALLAFTGTVAGSPGVDVLGVFPAGDWVERYTADEQEYVTVSRDVFITYRGY